ncbi:hypothetical protein [Aeromicrobium phragmitis]|nr:hypothetical protein [Aeromicrobium phragmitis]
MSRRTRHQELHHCLALHLIMIRKCVLAASGPGADIAQPLDWPGKSIAVEVLASEPGPGGRTVEIDVGLLRRHVEAPIPVYYVADIADWNDHLDPVGYGPPPYVDEVVGVWSARSMVPWLQSRPARGVKRVDLNSLPVLGWRDFLKSFVRQSPEAAPPARLASDIPLSPSLLSDAQLAAKIADQQTDPCVGENVVFGEEVVLPLAESFIGTPPSRLYDYVPSEDGYVECDTATLKDELRRFAAETKAERPEGRDGLMVLTLPWRSQIFQSMPRAELLAPLLQMPAVPWPEYDPETVSLEEAEAMEDDPF